MSKEQKHKRKNSTKLKIENQFLKEVMGQMVYVMGAGVYEMNRLIADGGKVSENTEIINKDYNAILEAIGVREVTPGEKEESKDEEIQATKI